MNRIAINIARWALKYLATGDRIYVYMDRVRKVQGELDGLHDLYFVAGRRRWFRL